MKDAKVVSNPKIARNLLKLGYRIIDIKPNNRIKGATAFVFKVENNFEEDCTKMFLENLS